MADLFEAHEDVKAGRVPKIIQFGSGPLSVIDPSQAPPGKHTTYCWHVLPLYPQGGQDTPGFNEEFADKIIDCYARYCPNLTRENIIGQYIYTGQRYSRELINMRGGDIFMGAFNAEQVMYNHFGYRSPIPNLYSRRLARHIPAARSRAAPATSPPASSPRELGIKPWWTPWDARAALERLPQEAA